VEGEEAPPRISCEDIFQIKSVLLQKIFLIRCNTQAKEDIFVGVFGVLNTFVNSL